MVSNDLVDGFIPKNEMAQCNLCRKQSSEKPFTCEVYPDWIPKQKPVGTCPYYEPDEQDGTQKKRTAPIIEDGKTLDELVAGDKYEESIVQHERELGATDEEIWEFLNEL